MKPKEKKRSGIFGYFHSCLSFHLKKQKKQLCRHIYGKASNRQTRTGFFKHTVHKPRISVADPDPYVFGPPGSFYQKAKTKIKKNLASNLFHGFFLTLNI
jgi:hypothetical protein